MLAPAKAVLRAELRTQRAAMDASTTHSAGVLLANVALEWLETLGGDTATVPSDAAVVCAYISTGKEPPTNELLSAVHAGGYNVYVPVCEPDFQLSWVRWFPGVELKKSTVAPVLEAVGERVRFAALPAARAILVPALAVDSAGMRLGQGGGYYDRFLADRGNTIVAAVVYDHEVLPHGTLPYDSLDMPVRFALTPSGAKALTD